MGIVNVLKWTLLVGLLLIAFIFVYLFYISFNTTNCEVRILPMNYGLAAKRQENIQKEINMPRYLSTSTYSYADIFTFRWLPVKITMICVRQQALKSSLEQFNKENLLVRGRDKTVDKVTNTVTETTLRKSSQRLPSRSYVLPFYQQQTYIAPNISVKAKVRKTSKPVLHQFYMEWKKERKIFYNEINPNGVAKLDVLLLHGLRFNSSTWVHLKTMDILVSSGFRVIAMDLPGYGKSDYKFKKTDKSMGKFLAKFIKRAGLNFPVIVSPSTSGRYSLPYITGSSGTKVRGFVPIAAVATDRFPLKDYKHFRAPTLIMRGSKDIALGKTSMEVLQKAIPHSEIKIIGGARHACYLDKPKEFHEALLKFLNGIVKS